MLLHQCLCTALVQGGNAPLQGCRRGFVGAQELLAQAPVHLQLVPAAAQPRPWPRAVQQQRAALAVVADGLEPGHSHLQGAGGGVGKADGVDALGRPPPFLGHVAAPLRQLGHTFTVRGTQAQHGPAEAGQEVRCPALAHQGQLMALFLQPQQHRRAEHHVAHPVPQANDERATRFKHRGPQLHRGWPASTGWPSTPSRSSPRRCRVSCWH